MDKPSKTKRNRAYYRHQRKRVIKAKSQKKTINWIDKDKQEFLSNPKWVGKLHKGAAYCSCKMCRYEQHMNIPKAKVKAIEEHLDKQLKEHFEEEGI